MANVPNSSLYTYLDGVTVTASELNQDIQVLQAAINDNQTQITNIKNAQATVLVTSGSTYPSNPSNGELFYHTGLSQMKMYLGGTTGWVDAQSVVATATQLSLNGTNYVVATSATGNTVVVRDGTGSITAVNCTLTGQLTTAKNTVDDGSGKAIFAGPVTLNLGATVTNGYGLTSVAGASFTTGTGGGTWTAKAATNSNAFSVQDTNSNQLLLVGSDKSLHSWLNTLDDGSGNMTLAQNGSSIYLVNSSLTSNAQWSANSAGVNGINGDLLSIGQSGQTWKFAIDKNGNISSLGDAKAANNYLLQALSGGYKVQSGSSTISVATAGTAVTGTITFPTAFSGSYLVFLQVTNLSVGSSGYVNLDVADLSNTGHATIQANSYVAQTISYEWFAIGQ